MQTEMVLVAGTPQQNAAKAAAVCDDAAAQRGRGCGLRGASAALDLLQSRRWKQMLI